MWERVLRGVHQGSVLGPTLFNVFINGLAYTIKQCRIINYADDTNIHRYSRNVRAVKDNLNNDFKNSTTCRVYSNGLKSNSEKYQVMVLFAEQKIGDSLNQVILILIWTTQNGCGVVLDSQLKFDDPVSSICLKVSAQRNAINRLKNILPLKTTNSQYFSFILHKISLKIGILFLWCPWGFC